MPSRNLVVVRAGDRSLHPAWLTGGEPEFDLIVSYFGDDPERYRDPREHRVDQKGGFWDGIHALLRQRPELLDAYDHFFLPDDDIAMDTPTINEVFRTARHHGLHVCQPALSLDSHLSWLETVRQPRFRLRFTTFVEVMAPCLSRELLERCLPLFPLSISGFGIDMVWTRLLPPLERGAAIIDSVQVRHTRPVGSVLPSLMRSAGRDPWADLDVILGRFGVDPRPFPVCYAAIAADGSELTDPVAVHRIMRAHLVRNLPRLRYSRRGLLEALRGLVPHAQAHQGLTALSELDGDPHARPAV